MNLEGVHQIRDRILQKVAIGNPHVLVTQFSDRTETSKIETAMLRNVSRWILVKIGIEKLVRPLIWAWVASKLPN